MTVLVDLFNLRVMVKAAESIDNAVINIKKLSKEEKVKIRKAIKKKKNRKNRKKRKSQAPTTKMDTFIKNYDS